MGVRKFPVLLLIASLVCWSGCGGGQPTENPGGSAENGGQASSAGSDESEPSSSHTPDQTNDTTPTNDNGGSPAGDVPTGVAPGQLDTSYISPDFVAAFVVHPRHALESKVVKALLSAPDSLKRNGPLAELEMAASGEMPGARVEQVIGLLAPSAGPLGVEYAAIFRFRDAKSAAEMTEGFVQDGEPRQYNGKTYYFRSKIKSVQTITVPAEFAQQQIDRIKQFSPEAEIATSKSDDGTSTEITLTNEFDPPPGTPNAVYLPDGKTVVTASETLLRNMLDAQNVGSPLVDRLKSLGPDHDLAAFAFIEQLRPAARRALGSIPPQAQPFVGPFASSLDSLETATITAGLDASPLLELKLESSDDASAARLASQIDNVLKIAMGMYGSFTQKARKEQPQSAPLLDYGDKFLAGVVLNNDGKQVTASLPHLADVDKLPGMFQSAFGAQIAKVERMNRMRQILLGIQNHMDQNGLLPGNLQSKDGKPLLSWRVALLPYLEQKVLFDKFNPLEPWDSDAHKQTAAETPEVYKSVSEGVKPGYTTYLTFQGPGTMLDGKKRSFASITDGTSNTVAVIEVSPEKAVPWAKPADIDFTAPDLKSALGPAPTKEGYPAGFFDGHVAFIPEDTDMDTFKRMVNFSDGQPRVLENPASDN